MSRWGGGLSEVGAAVVDWVRRAPLTYGWLAVLLVTSIVQRVLGPNRLETLLARESTNLDNLRHHPIRVLVASLFWIDGIVWLPYLFGFTVTLAVVEHWLGWRRLLVVGLLGHVLGTFISEGILALWISRDLESEQLTQTIDVGVSYFLAAGAGVMVYRVGRPLRWGYLLVLCVMFVAPALIGGRPTFTELGHLSALLIGLGCYPLTRNMPKRRSDWDPRVAARA